MYKIKVFHNFSESTVNRWLEEALFIEVMDVKLENHTLVILYKTN
jgi:hypothetical protein